MAITQNLFDVSVLSWTPDAVEPQLCYPAPSFSVRLAVSTTYPKGSWISELTDTPGTYGLYAHSGSNGLGSPKALLPRAYVTDSSGNIFEGAQASVEVLGITLLVVPAYFGGIFKLQDLNLMDANAVADLLVTFPGSHILRGAVAGNGLFQF